MIDPSLGAALRRAARASRLLVACDYDGTLAPIVNDPSAAIPYAPAVDALVALATYADVGTVIISGRSVKTLVGFVGVRPGLELIGDHGAELTESPAASKQVVDVTEALRVVAVRFAGAMVEPKPLGAAFHYRHAAESQPAAEAARGVGADFGARVIEGKQVVEVMVGSGDKGTAISRLARRDSYDRVVFFGDDVTDEDVFAILDSHDVGVKVGPGPTRANYRVRDPQEVAEALGVVELERRTGR